MPSPPCIEVTFWGVRGSIPSPGVDTHRWGGNSSCLEVRYPGAPGVLVFDCGTGARALGERLVQGPARRVDLLFTHLHIDHLFGFPYFRPLYDEDFEVRVTVPAPSDDHARAKVAGFLNGVLHPVRLEDMASSPSFHAHRPGDAFALGPARISSAPLHHPGGSVGYRLDVAEGAFAYITDTAPLAREGEGLAAGKPPASGEQRLIDLLSGAHTVVFDTMFDLEEYRKKPHYGHSYPEYAVALCERAGVERLYLFHHRPQASDDELDRRAERWAAHPGPLEVRVAREGDGFRVPCAAASGRSNEEVAVGAEG